MKLLIVVLLLAQAEKPAELTPRMKEIVAMGEKTREMLIAEKEKIVSARSDLIAKIKKEPLSKVKKGPHIFPTAAARKEALEELAVRQKKTEAAIEELKSRKYVTPIITVGQLDVGTAGIIAEPFRGKIDLTEKDPDQHLPISVKINQVVDANNMIVSYGKTSLWLICPTKGFVDDENVKLNIPVDVIGTKTYTTTIGGSRTILQLKAFVMPTEPAPANEAK